MGEVYRARDVRLGREVAVKVLPADVWGDEDRLRRFGQEARAASVLNHPNILAIHDIGTHEGAPYVVSELLEGQTLRDRLESIAGAASTDRGMLAVRDAVELACQIAQGLCAAHDKGIVHRDIKPENVFLRSDGFVKILDFGLAKLTEPASSAPDSGIDTLVKIDTEPGTVLGTIKYMSPEQLRGLAVDLRTDVFSLGVVLYEMLAGETPFQAATRSDMIVAILEREPKPLARVRRDVPTDLDRIVAKALCKRLADRYVSAKAFVEDLRAAVLNLDVAAALATQAQTAVSSSATTRDGTGVSRPSTRRKSSRKPIDSLAVLPLTNASDEPGAEYLSDGITESIINCLAQLPRLRVVPRGTVFLYKGRDEDPILLGRELKVRAVLVGRVQQHGDTLVIKAELVDVEKESQLWGAQYARKQTDIFALQEEISNEISEQLRLKLSGDDRRRLAKRFTDNTEAYHLYLKGRYCTNKRTKEWLIRAIGYFQQSIDLDPNYALAYAGLADAYALLGSATGGMPPSETYPKAKAAAMKALEIDDTLGEAHTALGFFRLLHDWDWPEAEREFKRAIDLNPNYASAHDGYGFFCKVMGLHQQAIVSCRRALELDPLSPFINSSLGWAHYFARNYDRAIVRGQKVLEMDPNFAMAYWNVGLAYEQKGMYDQAVAAFQQGLALSGRAVTFLAHLARAWALAGRTVEAQMVLDELRDLASERYVSAYYFAIVHLGLGELDRGFEWLEKAFQERAGFVAFIGVEPVFDVVRADPRFEDLVRRLDYRSLSGPRNPTTSH